MSVKPHFPNLDASRFLAFLLVFFAHCFVPGNYNFEENSFFFKLVNYGKLGFLGLEYFFVLSSFLITFLILKEIELKKKLHIRFFLIRRALRVWPLYFIIVLLGYSIYAIAFISSQIDLHSPPSILYFLTFTINFYAMENGMTFLFFLAFLWSISIEEQFYLLWSFLMYYYNKRLFPFICLGLIILSLVFRYNNLTEGNRLYFHTVSTFANFGIGALAAYFAYYNSTIFSKVKNLKVAVLRVFYLLLFISIFSFHLLREFDLFIVFQRLFYAILFATYILIQAFHSNPIFKPGSMKSFNYLGKVSYGLYCYHGVVITILVKTLDYSNIKTTPFGSYLLFPILIFAGSVLFANVSYLYLEKPFLRIKKRFSVV